jgi:hypothetical protein
LGEGLIHVSVDRFEEDHVAVYEAKEARWREGMGRGKSVEVSEMVQSHREARDSKTNGVMALFLPRLANTAHESWLAGAKDLSKR